MKPEHAKEAADLVRKHEEALKNISDLTTCSSITTQFCGRRVNLDNRSKTFEEIKRSLIEMENQSIAQMIRRGNQIGLHF